MDRPIVRRRLVPDSPCSDNEDYFRRTLFNGGDSQYLRLAHTFSHNDPENIRPTGHMTLNNALPSGHIAGMCPCVRKHQCSLTPVDRCQNDDESRGFDRHGSDTIRAGASVCFEAARGEVNESCSRIQHLRWPIPLINSHVGQVRYRLTRDPGILGRMMGKTCIHSSLQKYPISIKYSRRSPKAFVPKSECRYWPRGNFAITPGPLRISLLPVFRSDCRTRFSLFWGP
jgi:hypothetical protein